MLKTWLKRSLWSLFAGTLLFLAAGCETVPYTERRQLMFYNLQDDIAAGEAAYAQTLAETPEVRNSPYKAVLERVGWRIAAVADQPGFPWEFKVIDSDVANAWCLPGGKVGFYTGIFPYFDNEAELAVVMGHEIGHAIARHGHEGSSQSMLQIIGALPLALLAKTEADAESLTNLYMTLTNVGVMLPYSRSHESEADYIGMILMAKAGYDPGAAVPFWEKFGGSGDGVWLEKFLSTHPPGQERVENMKNWLPEVMPYYQNAAVKYGYGEDIP